MDRFLLLDIETLGTDPRKGAELACIGWATESDARQVATSLPNSVTERLANPTCPVISHSKYDPVFLLRMGYDVRGPFYDTMVMAHLLNENTPLDLESCVEIYTGQAMDKRLKKADKKVWFTADSGEKLELPDAWVKYPDQVMHYCGRDVDSTLQLYHNLRERMIKQGWWEEFLKEHAPFTEVLVYMECAGLPLNLEAAEQLRIQLEGTAKEQLDKLIQDLGYEINFGSPKQLRTVLYNKVWEQETKLEITKDQRSCLVGKCNHQDQPDQGGIDDSTDQGPDEVPHYELPSKYNLIKVGTKYAYVSVMQRGLGISPKVKTVKPDGTQGDWSTSTPTLTVYHGDHPIVKDLIAYRKTEKVIGTYLKAYPEHSYEGRLYGRFNQTGTATGRLSHSNPNLGNQPTRGNLGLAIRGLFQGRFIIGDHAQLENRLMAHLSQDPVLLDIYRQGKDIHLVTAEFVFGKSGLTKDSVERDIAKTFGYAMGYDAAAPKLAQIMAINGFWTPLDRCEEWLKELRQLYRVFWNWKHQTHALAKQRGYVTTIGGRYRRLRWAYGSAKWKVRNKADRQAVNSIIQGSAADILRRNMLHCYKQFPALPMLNQIHDELIFDASQYEKWGDEDTLKDIQWVCENPGYDLSVPLKFEPGYCLSWADKGKSIELPDEELDETGEA